MNVHVTMCPPPSANKLWRIRKGSFPYLSEEYRNWRDVAAYEIQSQRGGFCFSEPVSLVIRLKRNHALSDLDNRIKPILDALQLGGVLENDNLVHHIDAAWGETECVCVWIESLRATTQGGKVAA